MAHFDLHNPAPAGDEALISRLWNLDTSTFGHWRLWGILGQRVRRLTPGRKAAGTAVTLALPGPDSSLLHRALAQFRPGDFVVIDRLGDQRHACVGGLVARELKARGVAGVLIDGPVTDVAELTELGLPLWCSGVSALTTRRLELGGRLNVPVSIEGVVIRSGDLLLADEDGVVVLEPGEAAAEIERAEARTHWERKVRGELDTGTSLTTALSRFPLPH